MTEKKKTTDSIFNVTVEEFQKMLDSVDWEKYLAENPEPETTPELCTCCYCKSERKF